MVAILPSNRRLIEGDAGEMERNKEEIEESKKLYSLHTSSDLSNLS